MRGNKMAYEYFFIDETDIKKEEKGQTKSRKMVFIGSREEVEGWLPGIFDPADFTFFVDGIRWAGSDFIIYTATANALNRFEWEIRLVAKNYRDFSGPTQGTQAKNRDLSSVTKHSISTANFTITAKMAGYYLAPTGKYAIDTDYEETDDSPFNETLDIHDINNVLKMDVHNLKYYLRGAPEQHESLRQRFSGFASFKGVRGRAGAQTMEETVGKNDNVYTEWIVNIEMPPTGFTWNTNWRGIT